MWTDSYSEIQRKLGLSEVQVSVLCIGPSCSARVSSLLWLDLGVLSPAVAEGIFADTSSEVGIQFDSNFFLFKFRGRSLHFFRCAVSPEVEY